MPGQRCHSQRASRLDCLYVEIETSQCTRRIPSSLRPVRLSEFRIRGEDLCRSDWAGGSLFSVCSHVDGPDDGLTRVSGTPLRLCDRPQPNSY
jgi:hypothetical protein